MNILVGGAGYVGSHVCKALAGKSHVPITYDNHSRGKLWAVKWGPFEKGDIGDWRRVRGVLEKHRPGALMHFAGFAYVSESMERPLLYCGNNFAGTAALVDAVINFQRIPVVFSSSCITYGVPGLVPIVEEHPRHPINPYGHSKLFVERMLGNLNAVCGLPWMALRYFNATGADPDGEIDNAYSAAHEHGVHWRDAALAIASLVTTADAIVSEKDRALPDFCGLPAYFE